MTILRNNFDTGPDGAIITAANSGALPGNNAFNLVGTTGTGITSEYSTNFSRPTAEFTAHVAVTGAASGAPSFVWTTVMGSQSQIWFREYVLWTAYPAVARTIFECDNGSVYNSMIGITPTGTLMITNSPNATIATSAHVVSLNRWYRFEGRFQFSASAGNYDVHIFSEPDSDTPVETLSGSGQNFGASTSNSFAFGYMFNLTNQPHMYLSGLELNNEGWPGPAPFRMGRGSPAGNMTNSITAHAGTG